VDLWVLAQQVQLAPGQLRAVKRTWFGHKDVHLEHRLQVDQVEGGVTTDCITHHLHVGVECIAQGLGQRLSMLHA